MRKRNTLVFNDFVYATAIDQAWTDASLNESLGRFDQTSIIAVADSVSGGGTTALNVQIEHSTDGKNWANKNASPEVTGNTSTSAPTTLSGGDGGSMPAAGLVRLSVWVTAASGSPSAHVKIYVCNRDQA